MLGYQHTPFDFTPPTPVHLRRMTAPLRYYFDPVFEGLDHVEASHPALLVGNHTLYGVLDVPLLVSELYSRRGVLVRALSDHAHYDVPGWRTLLDRKGAVEGTRENCARLMEEKQHVLVFPGGAREVAKRKDEKYKLVWKSRFGFVHMAIKYGYPIVPFAVVGPDDMFDIVLDADDVMRSFVGRWMKRFGLLEREGVLRGGDLIMPVTRGVLMSPLPRPERFYFAVGQAIPTAHLTGRENERQVLASVRQEVADAIYGLISAQMIKRSRERDAGGPLRRLLRTL